MNAQNVNQILDALAARFGSTGAHLWGVLIRQVYVEAIRDGISALVLWVVTILVTRYIAPRWKGWVDSDEMFGIIGACFVVIFLGIGTAIATTNAINSVSQLANPEYGALSIVLNAVHGK